MSERGGERKQFFKKRMLKKPYNNKKEKNQPTSERAEKLKLNPKAPAPEGTVEFLNINQLKKNTVRGLLRKRAKKYECKSNSPYIDDV